MRVTLFFALVGVALALDAFPAPQPPLDAVYDKYFFTWPATVQFCVYTADVHQTTGQRGLQRRGSRRRR